ncbi:MAG: 2-oxoglutarate dehydrogenase complex dihydrolipoyllysine-residue succinyltransferase [Oligoflexales bacterium]|nr:2-oxoglutarate dehydrogenase complex dihydrolipoyllysine-residue succinyltransferase [Oligoflexales bacterium]
MVVAVKVPAVGESVTEGMISRWHVSTGDIVKRDQVLLELDTDKATVEVAAETAGKITIKKQAGETVKVGEQIAEIDESAQGSATATSDKSVKEKTEATTSHKDTSSVDLQRHGPAAAKMMQEKNIDPKNVAASGKDGRVTKGDVLKHVAYSETKVEVNSEASKQNSNQIQGKSLDTTSEHRKEWREPMSMLRRRIAERLKAAQDTAALLTTFNEIDMSKVMELRKKYKDAFKERYGINLGFMSFFVKAVCEALQQFPRINGWIEGQDVVYHNYCDIGVAVSTEKGLMVPVIRNAEKMSLAEIETAIMGYSNKARDGKISLDDLNGGTFTISNGGVFGSLMSTPIINPPQSAILGMHKIQERPMAIDGEVKIRPMMYIAMSYDHRIVDGKEAVQFLVKVKDSIEDPSRLLLGV